MSDTLMFYQREGERKPPVRTVCSGMVFLPYDESGGVFLRFMAWLKYFPALGALVRLLSV